MVSVFRAVASLLVLALACVSVSAQTTVPLATAQALAGANDVTVLNYALTLENLESNFYQQGLALFPSPTFFNNISAAVPNGTVIYQYIQLIASHEASHVSFLTAAINGVIPGAAVPNCTYKFAAAGAFASPLAFLQTAATLENTGQTAYDGALNGITTPAYAQVAAQIATVEGRHAAFLNLITGSVPFPQTFDNATLPAIIAGLITPLLVSCPYNLSLPSVRPTGVTLGATNATYNGTGVLNGTYGYSTAQKLNDLVTLNYALTLEQFEAAFYTYVLATFTSAQFTAAGYPAYYYPYLQLIQGHEALHSSTLRMVIQARGGVPVPLCTYNFTSVQTPAQVLATAAVLENTGVQAYDGAANALTDTALQQVAAQIATVEARHAAFLNLVTGAVPFPLVQDVGTAPSAIIAAVVATGFISCPYTPTGPTVISAFSNVAATVQGDPAFVGFHGQHFQVHGIPSRHFALLSTPTLQVAATFTMLEEGETMSASQMKQARVLQAIKGSKAVKAAASTYSLPITTAQSHAGTFLGVVAMQLKGARVLVKAGGYVQGVESLELNGVAMQVSALPVQVAPGCFITYATPHSVQVDTEQVSFTLVNSDRFFNLEQATLHAAYTADMPMDGLLGQTADPNWQVQSNRAFKEHMVLDFLITGDIFSNEFVANQYTAPQ